MHSQRIAPQLSFKVLAEHEALRVKSMLYCTPSILELQFREENELLDFQFAFSTNNYFKSTQISFS
jgi:hypothetical protein